jgi:hypothetical protein
MGSQIFLPFEFITAIIFMALTLRTFATTSHCDDVPMAPKSRCANLMPMVFRTSLK